MNEIPVVAYDSAQNETADTIEVAVDKIEPTVLTQVPNQSYQVYYAQSNDPANNYLALLNLDGSTSAPLAAD